MRAGVLVLSVLVMACSGEKQEEPVVVAAPQPPPSETDEQAGIQRVQHAAQEYQTSLHNRLQDVVPGANPAAALKGYTSRVRTLGAVLHASSGVTLGRSAPRLRNPKNAPPDWVQTWFSAQVGQPAAGIAPVGRVDQTPGGAVARVILPIVEEASCLACHGAPASLSPDLVTALAAGWPEDQGTGYALGDLAGAIWAEGPLKEVPVAGLRVTHPGG